MSDPHRFDRLSKRHRDCLRGVRDLLGSKEIADRLGIEKTTVDGYLTEAVRIIGARNRRDAALQWARHEGLDGDANRSRTTVNLQDADPDKIGGDSVRLSSVSPQLPPPRLPDEVIVGASDTAANEPFRQRSTAFRLPFRREGQRGNDLSVGDRLIWIQAITLGIAIAFGMLMSGLQVLTGLIESVSRHLS